MSLPKNPQKFAQFLKLLNHCYQLSDEQLNDIQNAYENNEYVTNEYNEDYGDDDDEYEYYLFHLIVENFEHYNDDWKFMTVDFSAYISEIINQKFVIEEDEESEHEEGLSSDLEAVIEQLENESEYSLLYLESGNDTTDVLVVKKSDKPRLVELADELGLEVS